MGVGYLPVSKDELPKVSQIVCGGSRDSLASLCSSPRPVSKVNTLFHALTVNILGVLYSFTLELIYKFIITLSSVILLQLSISSPSDRFQFIINSKALDPLGIS